MTLILKSTSVATNYLSDITGVKDTSYLMSADFANRKYKLNGNNVALTDVITYTRTGSAYKYNNGVIDTIADNTPVFDDPLTTDKGIWSAQPMGNVVGYGTVNTSKTITHTSQSRIGVIFNLQVWGTGSVTVSGDVEQVSSTFTATQSQVIQYRTKANASDATKSIVTFTVNGSVVHYQTGTEQYFAYNHPTLTTVQAPKILVAQGVIDQIKSLSQFTILMRLKPALITTPNIALGLFEVTTDKNHAYAIINTQKNVSVGASDGVNNTYGTPDVTANGDTVIVVRYSGSKMTIYRDGLLLLEKTGDVSSVLSGIQFFATNKFASGRNNFVGLLKNIAVYSKSFTNDELQKISKSFSW